MISEFDDDPRPGSSDSGTPDSNAPGRDKGSQSGPARDSSGMERGTSDSTRRDKGPTSTESGPAKKKSGDIEDEDAGEDETSSRT